MEAAGSPVEREPQSTTVNGPKPVCTSATKKFTMSSARALRALPMSDSPPYPDVPGFTASGFTASGATASGVATSGLVTAG